MSKPRFELPDDNIGLSISNFLPPEGWRVLPEEEAEAKRSIVNEYGVKVINNEDSSLRWYCMASSFCRYVVYY